MHTALVNDVPLPRGGYRQVDEPKENAGEGKLFMEAMQMLLVPGPSITLQNQNESRGEKASGDMADLERNNPLLPGAIPVQGLTEPVSSTANGYGKITAQKIVETGQLQEIKEKLALLPWYAQPAPVFREQEMLNPAVTIGEKASFREIADPGWNNPLLPGGIPGGLIAEPAGQIQVTQMQELTEPVSSTVNGYGKVTAQKIVETGLLPEIKEKLALLPWYAQPAPVFQEQEMFNPAVTSKGQELSQLSTMALNNGQIPVMEAASGCIAETGQGNGSGPGHNGTAFAPAVVEVKEVVTEQRAGHVVLNTLSDCTTATCEAGAGQGNDSVPEQSDPSIDPAGVEIRRSVLAQATSGESCAESVFQPAQKDNKNVSGTRMKDALTAAGTVQVLDKGPEVSAEKDQSKPGKVEPFFNNYFQPDVLPNAAITSNTHPAESSRGVALPYLNDRLVQEIKHILSTGKGERQTRVQLKLEPEHLGRLTIKLFFNSEEVSAHFYTANIQVKDVLESSLQQLRDSLNQHDLKLNEAIVFTDNEDHGGSMGRSYQERDERAWSPYYGSNSSAQLDIQGATVNSSTTKDSIGVNYLI